MNEEIAKTVKQIKQSFRLVMNGITADSMRKKGIDYHLNWGANIADIRQLATSWQPDEHLASALWRENVRECKLMAIMLMPPNCMSPTVADQWLATANTSELVENFVFFLLQHTNFALNYALKNIKSSIPANQLCGFHLLSRMFANHRLPSSDNYGSIISAIKLSQLEVGKTANSYTIGKASRACAIKFYEMLSSVQPKNNEIAETLRELEVIINA